MCFITFICFALYPCTVLCDSVRRFYASCFFHACVMTCRRPSSGRRLHQHESAADGGADTHPAPGPDVGNDTPATAAAAATTATTAAAAATADPAAAAAGLQRGDAVPAWSGAPTGAGQPLSGALQRAQDASGT